jgi:hypothetical protein
VTRRSPPNRCGFNPLDGTRDAESPRSYAVCLGDTLFVTRLTAIGRVRSDGLRLETTKIARRTSRNEAAVRPSGSAKAHESLGLGSSSRRFARSSNC